MLNPRHTTGTYGIVLKFRGLGDTTAESRISFHSCYTFCAAVNVGQLPLGTSSCVLSSLFVSILDCNIADSTHLKCISLEKYFVEYMCKFCSLAS